MKSYFFSKRTIQYEPSKVNTGIVSIFVFMVFLLSFVISCTLLFSTGFSNWNFGNTLKATVEIPYIANSNGMSEDQLNNIHSQKVNVVMQKIKEMENVESVQNVDPTKIKSLLANWVGEKDINSNFRLPTLLDVKFKVSKDFNIEYFKSQLRMISSDIKIENHSTWSQRLFSFGKSLSLIAVIIGGFIFVCLSIIIALVTKSSLQAYYSTLDTLRLMGAKDSYIANIFQSQIMKASMKGGFIGFLLSIPIVYLFMIIMQHFGLNGITWNSVFFKNSLVLLLVPIIVTMISMLVSRITVLSHLKSLDAFRK